MATQELIDQALAVIREALDRAESPVVAWSGGKDSQVLLHLVRMVRPDIRVLHLRGFEHETKHAFADSEIERLDLNVIEPRPVRADVVARGEHVEVIEEYRLNDQGAMLYFPIEPEPDHIPRPNSHCGIEKLNQPCGGKPLDT